MEQGVSGVAGDVCAASVALAGLLLVYMGGIATSYEGYQPQERRAAHRKFRFRIWFAFGGLASAIIAAVSALVGKAYSVACLDIAGLYLLLLSFGLALYAALRAALDVG